MTYEWDRQSNKTKRTDLVHSLTQARVIDYEYDSAARMFKSTRSGAGQSTEVIGYRLDNVGNRGQVVGGGRMLEPTPWVQVMRP